MVERGVIEYFNMSEDSFLNRGPTVGLIEEVEEKKFESYMKLERHDVVLDFACGLGRWTHKISRVVKKVISIDVSPKLIQALNNQDLHNVEGVIGSEDKLVNLQNFFDKIIFAQGLEFYKDPVPLFKKFRNALREDGEIYLSTWTPTLIRGIDGLRLTKNSVIVQSRITTKPLEVFCILRTKKELGNALKNAGFKNIRVEVINVKARDIPVKIKRLFGKKFYRNPDRTVKILITAKAVK